MYLYKMSALSQLELNGCRKLLKLLPADDLLTLKDTVTNRMIAVESSREAIEAIITYSQNSEELLKRKKVHRDIIFKYLTIEGVVVPPNSEKQQLVKRTLELWSSGNAVYQPLTKKLVFCPNLAHPGMQCFSTPHGLVLVAVAGTIHRDTTCLGIFEQVFGLIRAPMDGNSWKIKSLHLKIKGQISREKLPEVTYDVNEMLQLLM
uniref:NTF2 domain-containing protein n=1 Tax=Electrophorus electricus TaxID=8005 RepID=A0A4W4FJG5_ELEEL